MHFKGWFSSSVFVEGEHFSGFHSTRLTMNRRGDHDDDYGDGLGFQKSQVFYYFWLNL
jgi:hypothetical protein